MCHILLERRGWYERVYFFLLSVFGKTWIETQIKKAYVNHTMLTPTPPHARCVLWCLRSQLWVKTQKTWSDVIRSEKLNRYLHLSTSTKCLFKILKFSKQCLFGMTSSILHPHSCLVGLLWQIMIVISFQRGCKTAPSMYLD